MTNMYSLKDTILMDPYANEQVCSCVEVKTPDLSGRLKQVHVGGYLITQRELVDESHNAGYPMYMAAWPLVREYPGREFQSGLFGSGYLPLPLTEPKTITAGKDMPTGNQCWTLFLNTANFKGPVAFFTPFFWSEASVEDPRLAQTKGIYIFYVIGLLWSAGLRLLP